MAGTRSGGTGVPGAEQEAEHGTDGEVVPEPSDRLAPTGRWLRRLLDRLGLTNAPASGAFYHGFISYSHAADGKLAPAIQKGLQRFAKPWYRVRALHIFRDDASLAANPELWGSIRDALEASEHLILLASPRAANSPWVAKEADYWRTHKSVDTILIGLTEGELRWQTDRSNGHDETSSENSIRADNALPATLDGAFKEEPRYVDLRWARNADDLSLSHPRWRDAIAELAAPLHGRPKDELASEEVRQHRRTLRIVQVTGAVLLALTAAAIVAGLIAYSQYRSAQARALAAEATADLGSNPERSLSEALRSIEINQTSTGVQALRSALAQAPERMAIQSGAGAGGQAVWSPDSPQIAITGRQEVQIWDSTSGRLQHRLPVPSSSRITQLRYSQDGDWLAAVTAAGGVYVWNASSLAPASTDTLNLEIRLANTQHLSGGPSLSVEWETGGRDGLIAYAFDLRQALVFDPQSGAVSALVRLRSGTSGVDIVAQSPDGSRLFIATEVTNALSPGAAGILDLGSNRVVALSPNQSMSGHDACWFADSRGFVTWDPTEAQDLTLRWWNATSGREVSQFPGDTTITATACSASAARDWVATGDRGGAVLLHLANGTGTTFNLSGHSGFIMSMASSADGRYLATASEDGTARIWDTQTGTQLRLLNDGDAVTGVQFSPDGGLVVTTDQQGMVRVWDTGVGEPLVRLRVPSGGQTYPLGFTDGGKLVYGLNATAVQVSTAFQQVGLRSGSLLMWSSATGAIVRRVPLPADITTAPPAAGVSCIKQGLNLESCELPPPDTVAVPISSPQFATWGLVGVAVSPDGSRVAYADGSGAGLIDLNGRVLARLPLPGRPSGISFAGDRVMVMTDPAVYLWTPATNGVLRLPQESPVMDAEISTDGRRLVTGDLGGTVTVSSMSSGKPIAVFHVNRAFAQQVNQISGGFERESGGPPVPVRVAINADGTEVAAGTSWETVFVWSVDTRRLWPVRFVSSPAEAGTGAAGSATAGGINGPWPIGELSFSADGSALVAVTFPFHAAGDSRSAAVAQVISRTSTVLASFQAPPIDGAIDPGVELAPHGDALLGGVLGVAATSSNGYNAVDETANGEPLLGLQAAALPAADDYFSWPSPPRPWAPDGTDLLAGDGAIYACAACGTPSELQRAARKSLAWLAPLTSNHDVPPTSSPYG